MIPGYPQIGSRPVVGRHTTAARIDAGAVLPNGPSQRICRAASTGKPPSRKLASQRPIQLVPRKRASGVAAFSMRRRGRP